MFTNSFCEARDQRVALPEKPETVEAILTASVRPLADIALGTPVVFAGLRRSKCGRHRHLQCRRCWPGALSSAWAPSRQCCLGAKLVYGLEFSVQSKLTEIYDAMYTDVHRSEALQMVLGGIRSGAGVAFSIAGHVVATWERIPVWGVGQKTAPLVCCPQITCGLTM